MNKRVCWQGEENMKHFSPRFPVLSEEENGVKLGEYQLPIVHLAVNQNIATNWMVPCCNLGNKGSYHIHKSEEWRSWNNNSLSKKYFSWYFISVTMRSTIKIGPNFSKTKPNQQLPGNTNALCYSFCYFTRIWQDLVDAILKIKGFKQT